MRLTRFRGWVEATTRTMVGALLLGLVLLIGSDARPGAGAPAEQAAGTSAAARPDETSTSREGRITDDAGPGGQALAQPTVPPTAADALIDLPLAPIPGGRGGGDAAAPPGSGSPIGGGAGDADLEAAVLSLVNQERAAVGCAALNSDGALTALARAHSADMRDRNFFSHTNPSGQSPWDRAEAAGIGYLAAENIAAGQSSATAVMEAWMGSPGHRANILNCSLRSLGVGVAHGGSYGIYWTQDFGG